MSHETDRRSGIERRRVRRNPVNGALTAAFELSADVLYLSTGGAMLNLPGVAPPIGSEQTVMLDVEGATLTLRAAVRNVEPVEGGFMRVGVEFLNVTDAQKAVLDAFVQRKVQEIPAR